MISMIVLNIDIPKTILDLAKAPKWKKAIIAYRYFVTCKALEESNK